MFQTNAFQTDAFQVVSSIVIDFLTDPYDISVSLRHQFNVSVINTAIQYLTTQKVKEFFSTTATRITHDYAISFRRYY